MEIAVIGFVVIFISLCSFKCGLDIAKDWAADQAVSGTPDIQWRELLIYAEARKKIKEAK